MTHDEITANIILEMMEHRKKMGYSREELAEKIGVKPWAIKRLETTKTGKLTIFVALLTFYRDKGFDINAMLDRGNDESAFFDPDII